MRGGQLRIKGNSDFTDRLYGVKNGERSSQIVLAAASYLGQDQTPGQLVGLEGGIKRFGNEKTGGRKNPSERNTAPRHSIKPISVA